MITLRPDYKNVTYPRYDIGVFKVINSRIEVTGYTLDGEVFTYIRKKHKGDGLYYLIPIQLRYNQMVGPAISDAYGYNLQEHMSGIREQLYRRLIEEAYLVLLFYKLDPNVVDVHGNPLFFEDPDQSIERVRLEK